MSPAAIPGYLEVGSRRVFAGALDWPGWCRSGRTEEAALQALAAYAPRYAAALGPLARDFPPSVDAAALQVVERLPGNATTDFGAPDAVPEADGRPLDGDELRRLSSLLQASWSAFDAAAAAAAGLALRKGPRGGGRDVDAIRSHVLEADGSYLAMLWSGRRRPPPGADVTAWATELRAAIMDALLARARGEEPPQGRRTRRLWLPRYFIRRSAWHNLDHAWEIQDRAVSPA